MRNNQQKYNPVFSISLYEVIEKLKRTSSEEWAIDVCRTMDGKNCLLGHLFEIGGNFLIDQFESMIANTYMFYDVNDKKDPKYQEPNARDRIIHYLTDIMNGKEKNIVQLMDEHWNE